MKKVLKLLIITLFTHLSHVNADVNRALIPGNEVDILLRQGSEYQGSGYYLEAQKSYQSALSVAQRQNNKEEQAYAHSALGYIAYLLHRPDQAAPLLERALTLAKQTKNLALEADIIYFSALTAQSRNQNEQAQSYLINALNSATRLNNLELIARCHLAMAQQSDTLPEYLQHQEVALSTINTLSDPALAGELRLQLAEQWLEHPLLPSLKIVNDFQEQRLRLLYQQLTQAHSQIPDNNQRSIARYFGLLGQLYESQHRYEEALALTQNALSHLQTASADDLSLFYNWQAARLNTVLHRKDAAIASYRRAISTMQSIRQDIPVTYQNGKSSFLHLFGPLYRDTISLLSAQPQANGTTIENPHLAEVLGLMEQLKQTELEDFFKDRCFLTDFRQNSANVQNAKTAVYYPIMLPDRIELILSVGDRIYQHTVSIEGEYLNKQIRSFASQLRYGQNYQQASQQFYDWLIRPLETLLTENAIETVIYIPDDSLRLLPLAALHDGKHYLIERYALVTAPSLALISPPANITVNKTLLAGLSEPSLEVAAQLADKLLNGQQEKSVFNRGVSGHAGPIEIRSAAAKLRQLSGLASTKSNMDNLQQIARSLALPGVKAEIDSLSAKLPNQILFNRDYTLQNFDHAAVKAEYSAIHVASHGFFGGSSKDSFILTYDKVLGIDHLEDLIKHRGKTQMLDLLV
jgi:CHAT domain-containing protein